MGRRWRLSWALGWVACCATAAAAEWQPHEEIRTAALAAFAAPAGAGEAALDPQLRLTRCHQPLQAVATGPRTAEVRCPDTPGWRVYVPVRIRYLQDVVVLKAAHPAGMPIAADDVRVQQREVGVGGAWLSDPARVVGQVPRRPLPPGVPLAADDFGPAATLRRGDPVVLLVRQAGFEVRMAGRALGPPGPGGLVTVENASSRRLVRGYLAGEGVVEVR